MYANSYTQSNCTLPLKFAVMKKVIFPTKSALFYNYSQDMYAIGLNLPICIIYLSCTTFITRNIIWQNLILLFRNKHSSMLLRRFLNGTLIYALCFAKLDVIYYAINRDVQDGVHAAWARETVDLLSNKMPKFILPSLWRLNGPDLITVFGRWCKQDRVYREKVDNVDKLKQRIVRVWNRWNRPRHDFVDQWHKSFKCVVRHWSTKSCLGLFHLFHTLTIRCFSLSTLSIFSC